MWRVWGEEGKKGEFATGSHFKQLGSLSTPFPSLSCLNITGCCSRGNDTWDRLCHAPDAVLGDPGKGAQASSWSLAGQDLTRHHSPGVLLVLHLNKQQSDTTTKHPAQSFMEILLLLFHCKQGIKKEERVKKKEEKKNLTFGRSSPEHHWDGCFWPVTFSPRYSRICRMWCNWKGLRRAVTADSVGRVWFACGSVLCVKDLGKYPSGQYFEGQSMGWDWTGKWLLQIIWSLTKLGVVSYGSGAI